MLTAALDSTAVTASAAVADIDGDGKIKTYSLFTVKNRMTHSETLLPMLDSAIKQYGASINDIELFAVSAGPGSFTGVRIGVATVKGLATPYNVPCAGVSTLEALACNLPEGRVCALMDARRNQYYAALFKDGKRITNDEALSAEEVYALINDGNETLICGDGALTFKANNCPLDEKIIVAPPACCDQNALSVALCGYRAFRNGYAVGAAELKPVYLRMPQAERERLERENLNNIGK